MAAQALTDPRYYVVTTEQQLTQVVDRFLSRNTRIFADTETTGFNPRKNRLVAVQIMQEGGEPVIIDWRKATPVRWMWQLLRLRKLCWVFHNASFDWQFLYNAGMDFDGGLFDTMVAEQLLYKSDPMVQGYALKDLVARYCGGNMDKSLREWFFKPAPLDERPDEWAADFPTEEIEYMALDIAYLPAIFQAQLKALTTANLIPTMKLEMRALPAVASIEYNGVLVDADKWRAIIGKQEAEAKRLESELYESELAQAILRVRGREFDALAAEHRQWESWRDAYLSNLKGVWDEGDRAEKWGAFKNRMMKAWREANPNPGKPKDPGPVNFGSSQQLMSGMLELGIQAKSTEHDELERLSAQYPELKPLLAWRKATKLVDSFGESLLAKRDEDGRIHSEYGQTGAATGRMVCSNPNWQQIPSKGDGGELRTAVVAAPGHKLVVADFPNIELRILAEFSRDPQMLAMFASGEDLHSFTARLMFDLKPGQDPKKVKVNGIVARSVAKTINFGVAYGQSEYGFALKNNVSVDVARGFIEKWYGLFAQARKYLDESGKLAIQKGYSSTPVGRKRWYKVPQQPKSQNWELQKAWKRQLGSIRRQGMNMPIQGTSADITKLALAMAWESLSVHRPNVKLVAVVHDEIVLEAPDEDAQFAADELAACMYLAAREWLPTVDIPEIEAHIGDCWEK